MKALIYKKPGEPKDVLELVEMPIAEPSANQVLVRMDTVAINHADLATVRGVYKASQKLPTTPGIEGVGEIIKVGEKVKGYKVGDRIIKTESGFSGWTNGTWQECPCWDESEVFPVPNDLESQYAAQIYVAVLPVYILIVLDLNLGPGQTVLVTAGGSTVGRLILQMAKLKGYNVISVVRRPEQVAELKALGATEVICSATEDITQKALTYTKLKGVDAVIESVGGETTTKCFQALAVGGKMRIFGMLDNQRDAAFDMRKMLFSQIHMKGVWLTSWWFTTSNEVRTNAINRTIELIQNKTLTPPVGASYSIDQYKDALLKTEARENTGRIFMKF